ncbi:MAG: penicillin acylase family protein, partial [Halobacteria archaeon]|nr:penicillin acylase family protein [Halobacteria archaeon]
FNLLGYKPDKWTPVDTLLISKQISWSLTNNFWDLERSLIADKLGEEALELYPSKLNHSSQILDRSERNAVNAELVNWLNQFESETGLGSNNWIVSG